MGIHTDMDNRNSDRIAKAPRKRKRLPSLIAGVVIGCGLSILAVLLVLFVFVRDTLPPLTEAALTSAIQRWEERGPKGYRLTILVSGERSGSVELEVRDGEPVSLVRDGRTPARHTWDFWTVPGQLDAIQGELTGDPLAMFGVPDHAQVIQRAEFDAELGYPRKYQRHVLGRQFETGWEIVKFEALE